MFKQLSNFRREIARSMAREESILLNQGRILSTLNKSLDSATLSDYEFKVFSQYGEDGILQFLTQNINIKSKTFIEFGVETFRESNCRFLMKKDLWQGFVIDGSEKNIESLKKSHYYWKYQLEAECAFITKDSINSLLDKSGFGTSPGILSIDIDGVDFHVLKEINHYRPQILIVEYNSNFGSQRSVTVPYTDTFTRATAHWSNQYYGASLPAFEQLANDMNLALVGVTSSGQNAFFVRRDLLNDKVKECSIEKCYKEMCSRDSRNEAGKLTHLDRNSRKKLIEKLPLIDTKTGDSLTVGDLPEENNQ